MKKLLCLSILTLGIFVSVEAQTLSYRLENVSATATWVYKMYDSNGNFLNFATITPGNTVVGSFDPTAFPISWAADDNNGCGSDGIIHGPVGPTYPPLTCTTATVKYEVSSTLGGNFRLRFTFD